MFRLLFARPAISFSSCCASADFARSSSTGRTSADLPVLAISSARIFSSVLRRTERGTRAEASARGINSLLRAARFCASVVAEEEEEEEDEDGLPPLLRTVLLGLMMPSTAASFAVIGLGTWATRADDLSRLPTVKREAVATVRAGTTVSAGFPLATSRCTDVLAAEELRIWWLLGATEIDLEAEGSVEIRLLAPTLGLLLLLPDEIKTVVGVVGVVTRSGSLAEDVWGLGIFKVSFRLS